MKKIFPHCLCLSLLMFTACGQTGETDAKFPYLSTGEGLDVAGKAEDITTAPPEMTALEFIESYLSMESALFDTLISNMKEHPETSMDAVYLNDATSIRRALENAAVLWERGDTGQGDIRTATYIGGSAIKDGKPVQIEETAAARYEADKGRLTIDITRDGKSQNSTECVKTAYGYIAQHYIAQDSMIGRDSFQALISLRGADGVVGMEPKAKAPKELTGNEAFELPLELRDWFALEGPRINLHSEEGANMEFEVMATPVLTPETSTQPGASTETSVQSGTLLLEDVENHLILGDAATIVATDKPSTGFLWTCEITTGDDVLEVVSEGAKTESNDMPGSDKRTLDITLKAVKLGKAVIDMAEKRGDEIGREARYTIIVTETPTATANTAVSQTITPAAAADAAMFAAIAAASCTATRRKTAKPLITAFGTSAPTLSKTRRRAMKGNLRHYRETRKGADVLPRNHGDIDNSEHWLNGKAEAADWLDNWAANIETVLMDSRELKMASHEGDAIDAGLYSEEFGQWLKYVMHPYQAFSMTRNFALTSLRGGSE
jgi:predicted secreted protein